MRTLVYGAGVIGSYLTHVLCAAGNDVTLLARGGWKEALEQDGLTIVHYLQRKTIHARLGRAARGFAGLGDAPSPV